MEIFSKNWRRSRYSQYDGSIRCRKNMKTAKFGGRQKHSWRVKLVPKLRLKMLNLTPLKIWLKLKNVYVNKMLTLGGNTGPSNALTGKRIPQARQTGTAYSNSEFDNRLISEIYKTLMVSRELGYE